MINYEIGKFYNFHVTGVYDTYIALRDDDGKSFTVSAFTFQSNWDYRFTPASIMSCYVKDISKDGRISLLQNRLDVLQYCYKEFPNKTSIFVINRVYAYKKNPKEKRLLLEDAFGIFHLYAPKTTEEKKAIEGDYISLYVCGIAPHANNLSNLILSNEYLKPSTSVPEIVEVEENESKQEPKNGGIESNNSEFVNLNLGAENQYLELKKTIIFTSGSIEPNIDAQMDIILKTLAGFMNAEGGLLYIGVNDEGYATGIENDYKYLNSSSQDTFTYKEDQDGFENKIRCYVQRHMSSGAELCLKEGDDSGISFPVYNGHTICRIVVQKSKDLIWTFRHKLFMRLGNHTRQMAEREIERVILERYQNNHVPEQIVKELSTADMDIAMQQPESTPSVIEEKQETPIAVTAPLQPIREGKGSFYMNFFQDGTWSYSRDIPTESDLYKCIPINVPVKKQQLLMIYADGCVNRVNPAEIKNSFQRENRKYANGRRNDSTDILGIYTALESDHIACVCEFQGHVFAKVHKVNHVSNHNAQSGLSSQGNMLIGANYQSAKILALKPISQEAAMRVTSLWKTGNQLSNSLGVQTDLPKYAHLEDEVKTLMAYCGL